MMTRTLRTSALEASLPLALAAMMGLTPALVGCRAGDAPTGQQQGGANTAAPENAGSASAEREAAATREAAAARAEAAARAAQAAAGEGAADPEPTDETPDPNAPDDVAAPPADAARTESGLASRVLAAGDSTEHPSATDIVIVHYTGWRTNGFKFDSSVDRGTPISFPLNRVIPGWTEGVQLMVPGEKRRLWIPESLAYQGRPGAPAGMLVFDVELLAVEKNPPQTPEDVAAPPANAERTESGIASVVLREGWGTEHPTETSTVVAHYSGWTTDGEMFDSSLRRGRPIPFPLNGVIPGWTEGVQLMVEGEKRRFWIPGNLAYDGQQGRPQGTLVFDVTLMQIQ